MKSLRQTCAVAILSLALTVSAFAGQIGSPGAVSSAPGGTSPDNGSAIAGTISSPGAPASASNGTSASSITTTIILTIVSLIR